MEEINEKKLFEYGYACVPDNYVIKCPLCGTDLHVSKSSEANCECGFKTDYNRAIIPYSYYKKGIKNKLIDELGWFITFLVDFDNVYFFEIDGELYIKDVYTFREEISLSEYIEIKNECNDLSKRLKQAKLIYDLRGKAIEDYEGNPVSSFYNFCDNYFKICKTTVKNLLCIYKRFVINIELENYQDYSYSQLVELLTFDYDELKAVEPSMSVRAIRELKAEIAKENKSSGQTSDHSTKSNDNVNEDDNDDNESDIEEYIAKDNKLTPLKVISVAEELKTELLSQCKYKTGSSSYKAYELACDDFISRLKNIVNDEANKNKE